MNFETVSQKHMNDLEQQVRQLLVSLRKARLQSEPLFESLQQLARELEEVRHERFDEANSEYHTY